MSFYPSHKMENTRTHTHMHMSARTHPYVVHNGMYSLLYITIVWGATSEKDLISSDGPYCSPAVWKSSMRDEQWVRTQLKDAMLYKFKNYIQYIDNIIFGNFGTFGVYEYRHWIRISVVVQYPSSEVQLGIKMDASSSADMALWMLYSVIH